MHTPELQRVGHSPSDESLFRALKTVVNASDEVVSRVIGSRPKQDRAEMKRILSHLPVVRNGGLGGRPPGGNALGGAGTGVLQATAPAPLAQQRGNSTARGAGSMPRAGDQRLATPRLGTAGSGGDSARLPATPRPQTSALFAAAAPQAYEGRQPGRGAAAASAALAAPSCRVRLAELGIDPEGMTATDILRLFYARSANTATKLANEAADRRLNFRVSTPRSFVGVFTDQAYQDVRRARDLPVTSVHDCLDKWEIDSLADVCRSLHHYDEQQRGPASEYMRQYSPRSYGSMPDRKKYVRPPV